MSKIIKTILLIAIAVIAYTAFAKEPEQKEEEFINTVGKITIIHEEPVENRITILAKSIQKFEGYHEGSRSYNNNNPGNLRYSPLQAGKRKGFAYFETYELGFKALEHHLIRSAEGKSRHYRPDMTLLEYFNTYAPPSDNNQPNIYYNFVIKDTGFSRDMQIKELL